VVQASWRIGALVIGVIAVSALLLTTALFGFPHAAQAENGSGRTSNVTTVTATSAHLRFTLAASGGSMTPNHLNVADRTTSKSPLLLFLAATRARPMDYRSFLASASKAGYHVLALDYWNRGRSVQATCGSNPQCYTDMQRNRLTGGHPNRFSSVNPGNSIQSRLGAALAYLRAQDPRGGWGRYQASGGIDWSRVVVAGHSQGGGEAAYISHIHRVRGALFFSSPVETTNGIAASWMHSRGKTSASRLFGFVSHHDMFYSKIRGSWKMLGLDLYGSPQSVGSLRAFSSHELVTHRSIGDAHRSHLRTITDKTPRTVSGAPVFSPVWGWMLRQLWAPRAA
jgi:predicted alpha/beta hydrolase